MPEVLFAGFFDPPGPSFWAPRGKSPVICFAGRDMRSQMKEVKRAFSLVVAADAPSALRRTAQVASLSAGSACVFTENESEGSVQWHTAMAQVMAQDLLDEDPPLHLERWTLKKPFFFSPTPVRIDCAPIEYVESRFSPKSESAHGTARGLWAIGKREKALELLRSACHTSDDPLDHFHLGELLALELEQPDAGVPHLRRACQLAPDVSQPFTSLGIALMINDAPAAVEAFLRAAELDPDDCAVWANLAQAYLAAGDFDRSKEAARRAQQLEPGEPITYRLLQQVGDAPEG